MKVGQTRMVIQDTILRRLSSFNAADLGPHATALYRELGSVAGAGLPLATIVLAASIVDVVRYEEAGPAGFLDGYLKQLSQEDCLKKGTEMAAKVIQQIGARL